jgi:hypothetical protein
MIEPGFAKIDTPDGKHALIFVDQKTGIEVMIPFDKDDGEKIKAEISGITVASGIAQVT